MNISTTMPAGTYYVGDLCYVFDDSEWNEVCHLLFPGGSLDAVQGEHVLSTGQRITIFNTSCGDGIYLDLEGRKYAVDSGTLGCVKVEDCNIADIGDLGHVVVFDREFTCTTDRDGVIGFGHVEINTNF